MGHFDVDTIGGATLAPPSQGARRFDRPIALPFGADDQHPRLAGLTIDARQNTDSGLVRTAPDLLVIGVDLLDVDDELSGDDVVVAMRFAAPDRARSLQLALRARDRRHADPNVAANPPIASTGSARPVATFERSIVIPPDATPGRWELEYVCLLDADRSPQFMGPDDLHPVGLPTGFDRVGDVSQPLQVRDVVISRPVFDHLRSETSVDVSLRLEADRVGAPTTGPVAAVRFTAPVGDRFVQAAITDRHLLGGDSYDGRYGVRLIIPEDAPRGLWTMEYVYVIDATGGTRFVVTDELRRAGLPVSFHLGVPPVQTPRAPRRVIAAAGSV